MVLVLELAADVSGDVVVVFDDEYARGRRRLGDLVGESCRGLVGGEELRAAVGDIVGDSVFSIVVGRRVWRSALVERQGDVEGGAAADDAVDGDRAAERVDDLLHQSEPDARAGTAAVGEVVGLVEFFEDVSQVFGRDALAIVGDVDTQHFVFGPECDVDAAMSVGEFEGVGEQVADYLGEIVGDEVGVDVAVAGYELEADAHTSSVAGVCLDDHGDVGVDAPGAPVGCSDFRADLGDVEQLVDEGEDAMALSLDGAREVFDIGVGRVVVALEVAAEAEYDGERGAEFVGDVGEE